MVLKIENLTVRLPEGGDREFAIEDVTLNVEKGEIVCVVGESGSGKSVTAFTIMGLIPRKELTPVGGKILLEGDDLLTKDNAQMRKFRGSRIGMIFQEPMTALNPVMKVGKQIAELLTIHTKLNEQGRRKKIMDAMNAVKLPEPKKIYDAYPHQLSGGQRQRIMIAMALVNKPELLIADEPTTALDVTIQAQILDLMSKLKKELGMSILFITHDLGLVKQFSDQVCVMQNGKIVEKGDTDDVFNNPSHSYTQKLLNAEPQPKENINNVEKPLIEIKSLDVFYDMPSINFLKKNKFHAVKDISLNINKNTTIGLVGESGSGKSTLGKAIANLINFEGNISFDGKEISKSSKEIKKHIQIVFQDPYGSLSPRMTVGEIVGEGLGVHFKLSKKESETRIDKVLSDVGIELAAKNKYPHEFSGGQRQRIAIARSLIMNPAFMILDEPTSALDRSIQIQVINLLKDIQDEYELTYLFISHDLKVIRSMSDYIFVMKDGKIVESGVSSDVFEYPKEKYTKKLLAAALRYASN